MNCYAWNPQFIPTDSSKSSQIPISEYYSLTDLFDVTSGKQLIWKRNTKYTKVTPSASPIPINKTIIE